MNCNKCGYQNNYDAKFCEKCGNNLLNIQTNTIEKPNESFSKTNNKDFISGYYKWVDKHQQYFPSITFLIALSVFGIAYLYGNINYNYVGTGFGFFFAFIIIPITAIMLLSSFGQAILQVYKYHKNKDYSSSLIVNILNWIIIIIQIPIVIKIVAFFLGY